jgi:hypothetical protein
MKPGGEKMNNRQTIETLKAEFPTVWAAAIAKCGTESKALGAIRAAVKFKDREEARIAKKLAAFKPTPEMEAMSDDELLAELSK